MMEKERLTYMTCHIACWDVAIAELVQSGANSQLMLRVPGARLPFFFWMSCEDVASLLFDD